MSNSAFERVIVPPMDEYNQKLIANLHPNDWKNPEPADCYDLIAIGAGAAGLVTSAGAAGLGVGLKVALIEKHLMGGDCTNVGCVPSKCLIRSARVVGEIWNAKEYGIHVPQEVEVDFPAVMERMRRLRAQISHVDAVDRFTNEFGMDIFLGAASFTSSNTIEVAGKTLRFKKAVIATGARATHPDIPGMKEAGYLTNETVFSLTQLPRRLAIIGGGPIGCELAQAFNRFGSEVTILHRGSHILNKEDSDAASIVQKVFQHEQIDLVLSSQIQRVESTSEGKKIHYTSNGKQDFIIVDEILVGAGRTPNVEGLNLETVGVEYDSKGVKVNDHLQTTNPKIFAAGDICLSQKFTHMADATARIVIQNALFTPFGLGRKKLSDLVVPWVTFTDPEIAHVGMYESEAQEKGLSVNTIKIDYEDVDRAITDGETAGFVKVHLKEGTDKILGATIVSPHAGETISEVTTAIVNGIGMNKLSSVIHPYPTQAEGIKKAADAYKRTKLTDGTKKLLGFLHKFS
ncbi:MAG: mercuric reductase [Richelia sp. RM2_1_2]|nr:mercuric reductase [Richelia sp. RM1_1_1]NJO28696.1 mercuric reductase [Richelia sp. SL_2_1]NJO60713.1 mercuric reductase [Richelia sp. RM2_1_2]